MVEGDRVSERPLSPVAEPTFSGMFDNDSFPVPQGFFGYVENFYFKDGNVESRPGYRQLGSTLPARIQGVYHFEELDGTLHTVAISNGDLYDLNWGTEVWGLHDLSVAGITLSSAADVDFCVSRGRLIVTDGVNKPFMWDPANTTFTQLTNAPIADGCCIYYDKVFFYDIPGAENQFEWSDEGDPVNGYAGEDQAWEFAQTDAGRIVGLAPLNAWLFVFKGDSIAKLAGNADENFQTDAVREGVSTTEGLIAQRSIVQVDEDVYYLSERGPRLIRQGQMFKPAEDAGKFGLKSVWDALDTSAWSTTIGVFDKARRHVIWIIPQSGGTGELYKGILYAVDDGAFSVITLDSSVDFGCIASAEDSSGTEHVLLGAESGKVYLYGESSQTSDDGVAISRVLRSREYGRESHNIQRRLAEVHLLARSSGGCTLSLAPIRDGTTLEGREAVIESGRTRYRRGFNVLGWTVGWELTQNELDEEVAIEGATVFFTGSGMHGDA